MTESGAAGLPAGDATVRVVVADDQAAVRDGLVTMLDLADGVTVVGAAADGERAIALATTERADVVLMDLHMPGLDGVAATGRIRDEHPRVAVVVLTTYADDTSILAALRAGARGYLTKDAGRAEIARAVRAAAAGQAVLDRRVQEALVAAADRAPRPSARRAAPPDGLTPREVEVLALIAAGLSNREIAASLVVGESTVKSHINSLFAKAGLRDRAQAVRYAYQNGVAGGQPDR